jgi:ribosomal protection tetracycline resistance protein
VLGTIQLEVLKEIVKDRFQLDVSFGEPKILYKETIESEVDGWSF